MSFRARIALLTAACVASVVAIFAVVTYVFVRNESINALDRSLSTAVAELQRERGKDVDGDRPGTLPTSIPVTRPGGAIYFTQLVSADGRLSVAPGGSATLPVTPAVLQLAKAGGPPVVYDAELQDGHVRVRAESYGKNLAVLVAAPITELERTQGRLRAAALVTGGGGAVLGGVLGLLVAGAAVRPVGRLTDAAERVARTRDLSTQLPVRGRDELSRLTATFNEMLTALQSAEEAQRRLIGDVSHELRTPLTALRLNAELLTGRGGRISAAERRALLADVLAQARELSVLIGGILDLARGHEAVSVREPFALDEVIGRAISSARRDWPDVAFDADLEPTDLTGDPARLERAVINLLGNAAKYAGDAGPVRVRLSRGVLTVADSGPGIAASDREAVFDRFTRLPGAQDLPGSGLGLAIVRQAVEEIGGTVLAGESATGGALFTIDLSAVAQPPA